MDAAAAEVEENEAEVEDASLGSAGPVEAGHALVGKVVRVIAESAGDQIFGHEGIVELVQGSRVRVRNLVAGKTHKLELVQVQEVTTFKPSLPGRTLRGLPKFEATVWLEDVA